MGLRVRIPPALGRLDSCATELTLTAAPPNLGALLAELERRYPGLGSVLDSSAVNAAVNGAVILHGRDATPLHDGDEVEFLVMFAGG